MPLIPKNVEDYAVAHSSVAGALLDSIAAYTVAEVPAPQMLSSSLQGRVLAFLSKLLHPQRILEIGTYTGYSALCLCEGLHPTGELITLDIDAKIAPRIRQFFATSPWAKQITYKIGEASTLIPNITAPLDIVFIDADKANYPLYYQLVIDKLRVGGLLIADNVLWSEKVLNLTLHTDKATHAIHTFNQMVQADSRVDNVLLPIRDGLMVVQKNH